MRSQKDRSEQDANTADNEVCDAQEGVLAAHDGARGDEDGFCAAVFVDGVAWGRLVGFVGGMRREEGREGKRDGENVRS